MTPLRPEPQKPQATAGSIFAGLAVGCVGLVILVPLGLCTSALGIMTLFDGLFRGSDGESIMFGIACIPALVIAYFVIRTAIRIGRGG